MSRILTLIEQDPDGTVQKPSQQVLTFARNHAAEVGAELQSVVVGPLGDATVDVLREQGVDRVHVLEHELLAAYAPEARGEALTQLIATCEPRVVVAPATERGTEVLAHVAARTDLPLAADCLELRSADRGWALSRQRWGGVLIEDARLEAAIALVTAVPHATTIAPAATPGAAAVSTFAPQLDETLVVTRVRERITEKGGVSLATAPVVVSGGRGVGSADGFALLEELAELLGGAVGCSRVATNNGWRSHNDQVGQTGTRVAPDLYIALGISGATQHWVGCMGAKRILAVNTDEEAPLVTRADYAVVGDLHELLPGLVDAVRRRKGAVV